MSTEYKDEILDKWIRRIQISLSDEEKNFLKNVRKERKDIYERLNVINEEKKTLLQKYEQLLQEIKNKDYLFLSKTSNSFIDISSESMGLNKIDEDDIEQTKVVEERLKENPIIPESVPRKLEEVVNLSETQFEVEK